MEDYLDFAKELAQEAGGIMKRYFLAPDIGTILKKDKTPLTVADTTINQLVIEKVKAKYPAHDIIGEEASDDQNGEYAWVVDPIDGTIPFSMGIPLATFSLGVVNRKDGQPVAGVILDPFLDKLYWSAAGKSSFVNDSQIVTSQQTDLTKNYVSILGTFGGDGKTPGKKLTSAAYAYALMSKNVRYFSIQSQAYSAARVASGDFLGSIFAYGSPWDSAAAALIVQEAGGIVTDMLGQKRRFDEFANGCVLSANETVHQQLLEAIEDAHNRD